MSLPDLTLSSNADAGEVWEMFWYMTQTINGRYPVDQMCDFGQAGGDSHDFSATSRNLMPHKILWSPDYGHSHSMFHDNRIGKVSEGALRKKHLDLNSTRALWLDMEEEATSGDRFAMISGLVQLTVVSGNKGSAPLPNTPFDTTAGRKPDIMETSLVYTNLYDPTTGKWETWDDSQDVSGGSELVGYIVQLGDYHYDGLHHDAWLVVQWTDQTYPLLDTYTVNLINADNGLYEILYMMFYRYVVA